jgi:iron complex transport system substrate-binding protein
MKKPILYLIVSLFVFMLAACGSNANQTSSGKKETGNENKKTEELTIQHQLGETKVKKHPKKVVVFDFGVLDSLDKLGVDVTGVPKDNLPSYLAEKYSDDKYENVGGFQEPAFEKISSIDPDLIIISGRQSEVYEEFTKIAPTIFMGVDTANYLQSFQENMKTLGEIFEKESEVEKELAAIDESIQKLKEKAEAAGKNALVILANEGKVSAYGPKSRFGIIHDEFGLKAVDENIEVSTHGQSISFEYIVEKDPDYLFVVDRGAVVGGESSAKQTIENELVKKTKAYQNGHIIYLDPNYWYLSGGGLISVAEMIKEVDKAIQ